MRRLIGDLAIIEPDPSTKRALTELAFILGRHSSESEVKKSVIANLEHSGRACLTAGCEHGLTRGSVCKGYYTASTIYALEGYSLKLTRTVCNPLVQPFICQTFAKLEDHTRSPCKNCSKSGYSLRRDFDGLFCHGCGLFIDFANRRLGYAEEWTTRMLPESDALVQSHRCRKCDSTQVSAKFGDYTFCSKQCLQEWYFETAGPDALAHPIHH